jgi:hypothetical protein
MSPYRSQRSNTIISQLDSLYHGRIILRGIFRKWEGVVRTGWSGLRIGKGGWHL